MDKCIAEGHVGKVLKFKHRLIDGNVKEFVELWGCARCDATSPTLWEGFGQYVKKDIDHSNCEKNPCFGCKAKGLQLATGDAASNIIASGTTQKKWDKELDLYKQARAQGIQPDGTSTKQIQKSIDVSNKTGVAYDGSSPLRGIA